jgi:predicted component of type VI protein secretion system
VTPDPVPTVAAEPAPEVHAGSPTPRVRLIVQSGLEDGTAFDLPIGEWAVGRLPGSTIYLQDDSVSRRHALLSVDATGLTVTDDRSTNGTSVNGGLITRPTRIEPGDTVTFGAVEMLVARISSPPSDQADESPHHHHWPFHHDVGGEGETPAPSA